MNAAGTAKTVDQAAELLRLPVPAVMLGSYTFEERSGNEGSTYFETRAASLNSLGLPSPSMKAWSSWIEALAGPAHDSGKQLFVSVAGFNSQEFRDMTDAAFTAGADAVELNLGCPNVWDKGEQKRIFSFAQDQVAEALGAVSDLGGLPGSLGVKLSPIFDTVLLNAIDQTLEAAGLDFLTTTNTVPNCFTFACKD